MSASVSNKSVSVVIFDRTQQYGSDVPVFSAALKQKVNGGEKRLLSSDGLSVQAAVALEKLRSNPVKKVDEEVHSSSRAPHHTEQGEGEQWSQTDKLFVGNSVDSISSSRADSFGGQTNEFAQGEEQVAVSDHQPPVIPASAAISEPIPSSNRDKDKQTLQPAKSFVFEDPALIRPRFSSVALFSFLEAQIPITVTVPPLKVPLLSSSHRLGFQDFVYIPAHSRSLRDYSEPYWYLLKLITRDIGNRIQSLREREWNISGYIQPAVEKMEAALKVRKLLIAHQYALIRLHVSELTTKQVNRIRKVFRKVQAFKPQLPQFQWDISWVFPSMDAATLFIRKQKLQFSLVQLASRTLIAGSMVLMLLTVGPMVALEAESWRQQIAYSIHNMASQAVESSYPAPTVPPSTTATPTPTPNPDPEKQFQIIIPKIGINSKIIANVDPSNEKEYTEALKKGVAHAKGTGLPGELNTENKTIFIFGHSTNGTWNIARYNALFYSLKDLSVGDEFSVWFWGREFHYRVTDRKIVAPDDVSFLIPQTQKDQMVLQTCWPPGTSSKRLLVIAEPMQ